MLRQVVQQSNPVYRKPHMGSGNGAAPGSEEGSRLADPERLRRAPASDIEERLAAIEAWIEDHDCETDYYVKAAVKYFGGLARALEHVPDRIATRYREP
jgi:hypothetical protein